MAPRRVAGLGLVLACSVALVAGCGGDSASVPEAPLDPGGPRFELQPDGSVPVGRFNAELSNRNEVWETDPGEVAQIFVREQTEEGEQLSALFPAPGDDPTVRVTVSLENLADDSVDDLEVVAELARQDGDTWLLTSATWRQRCKEGRGHQELSTEPCV